MCLQETEAPANPDMFGLGASNQGSLWNLDSSKLQSSVHCLKISNTRGLVQFDLPVINEWMNECGCGCPCILRTLKRMKRMTRKRTRPLLGEAILSTLVLYMATYMNLVDLRIELAVPKKLMVLTQACESIYACDDLLPSCHQSLHQLAGPAKECPGRFGYSQESIGQRESKLSDTCSCLWEL